MLDDVQNPKKSSKTRTSMIITETSCDSDCAFDHLKHRMFATFVSSIDSTQVQLRRRDDLRYTSKHNLLQSLKLANPLSIPYPIRPSITTLAKWSLALCKTPNPWKISTPSPCEPIPDPIYFEVCVQCWFFIFLTQEAEAVIFMIYDMNILVS